MISSSITGHLSDGKLLRRILLAVSLAFVFSIASVATNCIADDQQTDTQEVETDDEDTRESNFLIRGRISDEQGNPIVGATIQTYTNHLKQDAITTQSKARGAFAMKVPAQGHYGPSFLVTDDTGELASFVSAYDYTTTERKVFNITVKPWRHTSVSVIDADQRPIGDATIIMQASHQEIARTTTNADGKAKIKYPADAKIDWINAFKDHVGYDYYENYDAFPTQDRLEVPLDVQLILQGAVSVTVTVTDDLNQPVEGASVLPWTIKLPEKLSYANLSSLAMHQTDADGKAVLKWIPKNLASGCTMLVYHKNYHCPQTPRYESGETLELTADVFRNCHVTGKVTFADGTPAAGIRLQGEGRGATNHYFRGHTITKADGTYEINIYPNQNTIIAVTDRLYAAKSATGIELLPGQKAKADFVLSNGTLIRGTLTVGKDRKPLLAETATLIQKDANGSLVRWNESDIDGDYYFRVGPGSYTLTLPGTEAIPVDVNDEEEIIHNGHIARRPRGQLMGTVVDHEDNLVTDAEVRGESINARGHAGFKTLTDSLGRFETERWMDEMFVYAVSRQQRLAGFTTIEAADNEMKLTLKPGAMVHGSAQDEAGQPLAGQHVQLSFSTIVRGRAVNFAIKTDDNGKFAFPSATGVNCKAYLRIGNSFTDSEAATIEEAKRYELPPFKIKAEEEAEE